MINRHLMARTTLTVKGGKRSMTALEALALRISNMELAGNPSATKLRLRLEKIDRTGSPDGVELQFEDNEYTRSFVLSNEEKEGK